MKVHALGFHGAVDLLSDPGFRLVVIHDEPQRFGGVFFVTRALPSRIATPGDVIGLGELDGSFLTRRRRG